jgi:hypothetical protein
MTKKQILELTGLSESEFYKKYPTKESFEKDAEYYKKGGIYIKPENRGKFTATKKRTGKSTEELTHSKNPLTRKRAIFAQNAKKWKHAEGGEVKPDNPGFSALPKSVQDKIIANMSHGGKLHNLNYEVGGKVPKHIAAGLYGVGEGFIDAATGGLTDSLTDKGFDLLTKVGNRKVDLNNPDDVKFLKTQQQIRGYSGVGGAVGAGIITGNVQGAVGQSAKGLNTAFQASDWAGDKFKKWSNISSGLINTGSKLASGTGIGGGDASGSIAGLSNIFGGSGAGAASSIGSTANTASTLGSTTSTVGSTIGTGAQSVSNGLNVAKSTGSKSINFGDFNASLNKTMNKAKPYINIVDQITGPGQGPLYKQAPETFEEPEETQTTAQTPELSEKDMKGSKRKVQKQMEKQREAKAQQDILAQKERTGGERYFKKGGELIKRADGSYSRRGLWDNIRANKGSGKAPTKEMLKQEAKIKAKMAKGGMFDNISSKTENIDFKKLLLPALGVAGGMMLVNSANQTTMAKGGKLEHLGDNLYKVKSHIKGTDKVEVRPNVFFDDKEIVRKNSDGSMQILSDDLGYAKPVEKVAKAMGGKAAQSLFNTMYTKQEMSKSRRPVDKFADNANERKNYVEGGPFSKKEEGDAFRQWVNKKYPEYAKKINLDSSGSFNNPYIKKAYKEHGNEYNMRFELPSMDIQEQQAQTSEEPSREKRKWTDAEDMMITEKNLTLNNTNIPGVNANIDKNNYYNNPEKYLKSKDEIKQFQTWVKQNKQTNLGNFGKNKDGVNGDLGKPGSLTRDAWNAYGDKFIQSKLNTNTSNNSNTNNSINNTLTTNNNTNYTPIYPTLDFQLPKEEYKEPIYPTPDLKEPKYPEPRYILAPDIKAPKLPQSKEYQMKQISPWWLAASEAGNIANLLMSSPDDVNLDRYNYKSYTPTLVDPYRANRLLASELRKQANATSSAIRNTANTQGTYLASEIANRSRLNEAIASQLAQSNLQSLLSNTDTMNKARAINADIINKARLANVDISTMEKDLRQREKDASRSIKSQALSQMGSNIMQYGRDRKQVDQTNAMLPYIAGENYYFKDENGKPVLTRKYNPSEKGSIFNPYFTKEKAGEKPTRKRFGEKIKN